MKRWIARCLIALMLGAPTLAPYSTQATVNSSVNKTTVLGNGAQTQFAFSFVGVASAYISVIFTDASGNQTALTQGAGTTQYQITLNPPLQGAIWGIGGTVTYNPGGSPIANGTSLTIFRTLPLTQAVSLQNKTSLTALGNGAETGLDLGVMLDQQNSDQLVRAITAPIVDPPTINLVLPTAARRANTGIAFDSQGNVIAGVIPATGIISSAMQPVVNAGSLAAGRAAFGLGGAATLSPNCQLLSNASAPGNLDVGSTLTQVAVNQAVTASFCGQTYIATGPINFTLPRANTLWNGFGLWIHVLGSGGAVTLVIDSHDTIEGLTSGVSGTLLLNSWAFITTDAAASGNWRISFTSNYPGASVGTVDNLLPNANFQQVTGIVLNVKQNATGTAQQTPASCSSFQTTNANPTFTCANTQQIAVGDIIVVATGSSFTTNAYDGFWGFPGGGAGFISCNAGTVLCTVTAGTASGCTVSINTCYIAGARVIAVVPNTSITVAGMMGAVSPASSSPVFLFPVIRGDTVGNTSGLGPDGFTKTTSLIFAPDDFAAHAYRGAVRTLFTRGGVTGPELITWTVPANQLRRFQGQTMSCGTVANQTLQGGAGTWSISIADNSATSTSANGTGVAFGGYQFESVTRTIAQNATTVTVNLNKLGNSGDVLYWALPTCAFVPSLVQSQLHQNSFENIRADGHCNPPLLTPLIVQFGTVVAGTLYGFTNLDLDALSMGCYDRSLGAVEAKNEWTTTTVGATLITGSSIAGFIFGPQAITSVSAVPMAGQGPLYLDKNGMFVMVTGTPNLTPTAGTFDFWNGINTMPNQIN